MKMTATNLANMTKKNNKFKMMVRYDLSQASNPANIPR
jgi:hypothetical protein